MGRPKKSQLHDSFDPLLMELPEAARWREWMGRVEAVIFAAPSPVPREALARLVGSTCNLDDLIADIRDPRNPDLVTHTIADIQLMRITTDTDHQR